MIYQCLSSLNAKNFFLLVHFTCKHSLLLSPSVQCNETQERTVKRKRKLPAHCAHRTQHIADCTLHTVHTAHCAVHTAHYAHSLCDTTHCADVNNVQCADVDFDLAKWRLRMADFVFLLQNLSFKVKTRRNCTFLSFCLDGWMSDFRLMNKWWADQFQKSDWWNWKGWTNRNCSCENIDR